MFRDYDEFIEDEYYQLRGKVLFTPAGGEGLRAVLSYAFAHDSPTYDDIAGPLFGHTYEERRGDLNAATPFFQANRSADNHNVALEVTYPFGMMAFTSLTTYAFTRLDRGSVNEGTPGEVFFARGFEDQGYTTQEFRLNYDSEMLKAVAGVYGSIDKFELDTFSTNFFSGGRTDIQLPESETRNIAVFGEASYMFVPTWEATLGGRLLYETEERDHYFSRDFTNPALTDILRVGHSENDITAFLPKAGIVKYLAEGHSLGFTVQRGFRAGGAGIDANDGSAYTFAPEYTWNFEASYRASFFANRVTLAANAFYTDWKDQQIEVRLIPGDFTSTVVLNAGSSHLYGGELDARFQFTPELSGFAAIGYVKTEFDDFVSTVGNFNGFPFPESPEWTIAGGLDYEHMSGFFAGADARHVSSYLARDIQNAPPDHVGDYVVANVRLGYRADRWSMTFFSDNVFNEEYFLYRDIAGTSDCCATLGPRRVTGVTLNFVY
jgi:outer membrane receptor protein involved in Fe transport